MNYEQQFLEQYKQFSNPDSQYYQKGYRGLLDLLNASSPTVNTLLGSQMAMGGTYKGSLVTANAQRRAQGTRNAETARKGFLDMYMSGQGLAGQALRSAQEAYQYEDSKPSFWEEVGGYALGGLTQALAPGAGGFLSGLFKTNNSPAQPFMPNTTGNYPPAYQPQQTSWSQGKQFNLFGRP